MGYSMPAEFPNLSDEPDTASQANTAFERWMVVGMLALAFLSGLLAMSPSVADPDLWGHVQFGRDVLRDGRIAETTSYSFTAEGYRWINHENLAEITMAWCVDHLGPTALLWGKLFLAIVVLGTMLAFNLRQRTSWLATGLLLLLVAWNLGYHWSIRPQLASFVLFTLLIAVLQFSFEGWRDRWHAPFPGLIRLGRGHVSQSIDYHRLRGRALWVVPVLMAVWANSHGGFVAGLAVYVLYLALRACEALMVRGGRGWGLVRRMALMALVAGLATLLNPYSYRLPMWLFESLGTPRPEISDWSSDQLFSMIGLKFWALVAVAVVGLSFSRKSLDLTQLVVLLIVLWQAVSHFRHVPFFAILCSFWLGPHLDSVLARARVAGAGALELGKNRWSKAVSLGVLIAVGAMLTTALAGRLNHVRVDRSQFPVDAFAYMQSMGLNGRLVVTYDWAQYAIAAFCADRAGTGAGRVAFDGRFRTCYPQSVVDMHFDFLFGEGNGVPRARDPESPPCDPTRVLKYGNPDLVILRRRGELTEKHIKRLADRWVLLYQDGLAQVWGRWDRYGNPDSADYVSPEKRQITAGMPVGIVAWPAIRSPIEQWADSKLGQQEKGTRPAGSSVDVVFSGAVVNDR